MTRSATKRSDITEIPIIDIAPLLDGSDAPAVAGAILRASREVGFLYVTNHGIPPALIAEARRVGLAFFRQPLARKLEVAINEYHRGFLKVGDAKMEDDALPDLKESFVWGYEPSESAPANAFRGANPWPDGPAGLKEAAVAYLEAAQGVAQHLLRAAAMGLGLPDETFLHGRRAPLSRGAFTYYAPCGAEAAANQFGVAPHTDFGVLTVLCQDDVGGLEVQGYDGTWIAAPPVDGSLVINVGDLLARWSNDKFRSTPHRVINRSGRERLSLVLAYDPDFETLIDPAVACAAGEKPRYEPITCGDYLTWRFGRSFDYRAKE